MSKKLTVKNIRSAMTELRANRPVDIKIERGTGRVICIRQDGTRYYMIGEMTQ